MATFEAIDHLTCPQCGYQLPLYFTHVKLLQCEACRSNIFLENDATRLAGNQSVLAPEISIIILNTPFGYEKKSYLPLGKIRYSYGRGFWEEWWLKDNQGNEYWLSVDEGDLVLETSVALSYANDLFTSLKIGDRLKDGVVTEIGEAKCVGFDGALPKIIEIDSTYTYAHLSSKEGSLVTLERIDGQIQAYRGRWISPFDITRLS
jgi:hypothetical protein